MPGSPDPSDRKCTAASDSSPADASPAVLLVEDDPLVRGYINAVLESAGHRVLEAKTGAEAMNAFASHRASIIATVVDLTLPGVSGLDVAAQLRASKPDMPIVLTSGHQDPPIPAQLTGPRTVFLQKPFLPDQLIGQLQKLIG